MKKFLILLLVLGILLASSIELRAETRPGLAVLPFLVHRGDDSGRGIACPICKGVVQKGEVTSSASDILTRLLHQKMEAMGCFNVLPLKKMEEAFSQFDRRLFELKPMRSSIQLGKTWGMDFIFIGVLFRFEERIGSSMGAEKPASVGFDVHLIRLKDDKIVWKGKFDETQKALSEDLLKIRSFFRRKASWLTAEELASVGMDEMLRQCPGPKELEEMP